METENGKSVFWFLLLLLLFILGLLECIFFSTHSLGSCPISAYPNPAQVDSKIEICAWRCICHPGFCVKDDIQDRTSLQRPWAADAVGRGRTAWVGTTQNLVISNACKCFKKCRLNFGKRSKTFFPGKQHRENFFQRACLCFPPCPKMICDLHLHLHEVCLARP